MPEWAEWIVTGLAVAGLITATILTCGVAGAAAVPIGAAMLSGGLISGGINAVAQLATTGSINLTELSISTLSGTVYGLVVASTGGAGLVFVKLGTAGGTSLLNSWNQNLSFTKTMSNFGLSIVLSGVMQSAGKLAPKVFGAIANSKVGQNVLNKFSNSNYIMSTGELLKMAWDTPAIKAGVVRLGIGIYDWINR